MTDTSDVATEAIAQPDPSARPAPPAKPAADTGGSDAPPPAPGRVPALIAGIAAVLAVVCGLALPFAPVSVNEPTVTWPRDPAAPSSTLLQLTAYRPLSMDVRFSCDVARLAPLGATAQDPRGIIVATALPQLPIAGKVGMVASARDGRVQIRAHDQVLVDEALPAGRCEYRITGTSKGLPTFVRPPDPNHPILPDLSTFAQPDNAHLTITRDGRELASVDVTQLPDVDVLATTVPGLPPALAGQLSVSMRTDDEFTSSPTPVKYVLIVVLMVALLVSLVAVALIDRTVARVPVRLRPGWPRLVDAVVPAVIVWWMFLAPPTDDDGYYAAMAHNSSITGRVGNFYQLYDQNFTPFTWFYRALGWWQQVAGFSPVAQRIPAAVFGILTWVVLRRFVVAAMREWAPDRRVVRMLAHAVLAVVYLAWWVALDMGVRPETVVAACSAAAMLAVLAAHRRKRLVYAWLAAGLGGLGFVAHPTGFTLFAPLLAGIPLLWPLLRVAGSWWLTTLRVLGVAAAGMVAPLMAFADGSLRDFLRGQRSFLAIQAQDNWTSEYQRYFFLLSQIPMGNYAKRAAVLACLLGLLWFAVLVVAARKGAYGAAPSGNAEGAETRSRKLTLPTPLWYAASTTALAFGLLWLTPSKWSHHFGALAGVGSMFLALLLVTAVPLLRGVLARDAEAPPRVPAGVVAAAVVSTILVVALAWHGPNDWPYAWLEGVRRAYLPPAVARIPLDSAPVWIGMFVLVTAVLAALAWRRGGRDLRLAMLRAVPIVLVGSLAGSAAYTVATFAVAAAEQAPREAVWSDPTGANCTTAGAVRVLDPDSAVPLAAAQGPAAPAAPKGFLPGAGFYAGNRPQGTGAVQLWGSLLDVDGSGPERNTGSMSTGWYQLPAGVAPDHAVSFLAAGTLAYGNVVTAHYGYALGSSVIPLGAQDFSDPDRGTVWRTLRMVPPEGADVVRIEAVDATGGAHGWLAFTAPSLSLSVPLTDLVPRAAPVALAWQVAFGFPCQRQPVVFDGITESVRYGVVYGDTGEPISGFGDGLWQEFRGGLFAQVLRSQSSQQLAVVSAVDPHLYLYAFGSALDRDAYSVTTTSRVVPGASTATG